MAQDLYTGFSEGLTSGVNMGLQIDQVRRQRQRDDWNQDANFMEMGFKLAGTLKKSPEVRATILNQVGAIWNKRFPHIPIPQVNTDNVDDFAPVAEKIANHIKLSENPKSGVTPEMGLSLSQQEIGNYWTKQSEDEGVSQTKQEAFKYLLKPLEDRVQARAEQHKESVTDSPSKIKAELLRRFLGGQMLSPQQEILIADDLADPFYKQAAQVYFNNPQNMIKKPDVQLGEIEKVVNALKQLQNQKLNQNAPMPTDGMPAGIPSFNTEAEAAQAFNAGKVKRGGRIKIGGIVGTWQ